MLAEHYLIATSYNTVHAMEIDCDRNKLNAI